ncbi:mechanosensitive ion channel family protein [Bacillaceae bacterium]
MAQNWFEKLSLTFYDYITDTDKWVAIGEALVKIVIIVFASQFTVKIARAAVDKVFAQRERNRIPFDRRRTGTLRSLVNNVIGYTVYFIAILLVLAQFGIDLRPVLAGAGVLGLAIGFGAQNLVRDVISGFFIIFEDQYAVGDYIQTGNFSGTVKEIGLRTTKIQSWTGEIHIIPNGKINEVTNYSIHNSLAVIDVSVAYEEDIDKVMQALQEIVQGAKDELEDVVADPQVLGVHNLGPTEVVIRITVECKPMSHFSVARILRAKIKSEFDKRGIEIPYPRLVTLQKEDVRPS